MSPAPGGGDQVAKNSNVRAIIASEEDMPLWGKMRSRNDPGHAAKKLPLFLRLARDHQTTNNPENHILLWDSNHKQPRKNVHRMKHPLSIKAEVSIKGVGGG